MRKTERMSGAPVPGVRGCEQRAIRDEIGRLEKEGMSRCEAFEVTAGKLCCSYEKVRNAFYNTYKH